MLRTDQLRERMRLAATLNPSDFIETRVLSGPAYAFNDNPESYSELIGEIAAKLEVQADQLTLIGSAKIGFSLNKDHLLKLFDRRSDLDLVVVAPVLFDTASLEVRLRQKELELAGAEERRRLKRTRENIFNGYLRPDQLPLSASLAKDWFPRLSGPFDSTLARRHPVKAWLFKSFDHAKICYTEHHELVQPQIRKMLTLRGDI